MPQKEQENFLKNAILIVDHTKTSLIALIDLDLKNKSLTFEQFLNKNRHEIYHLCYNRGKCCQCVPSYILPSVRLLYPAQLELLYNKLSPKLTCHGHILRLMTLPPVCCSFAQTGISTNMLDISLARCILTNFCHEVFWYSCLTFQGKTLEDFLNSNKHTIYHLLHHNTNCCQCPLGFIYPCDRPQIIQTEWNNMFSSLLLPCANDRKRSYNGTTSICSVSATPGISIHHLDLNLQGIILQYCCSLRKSVTDLADIRNVKYGHVQEARMSDADYKQVFYEIENNLTAIASVCGNIGEVKQKLQDLQKRTLDETLCLQYQNSLLDHLRYVNEMKDNVEICCKEVKSSVGKLRTEVKDLNTRYPRKLDKYYMQIRREQRTVQHSVTKLARQCDDKSKKVEQKFYSVVESIGDLKMNIGTRLDTVEKTVETMSKNVEELAISLPEKMERCIEEKGVSKRSKLMGLTLLEIEDHSKEDTFVTTSVVSTCIQLLKKNNVLVLTGRAGSGKSRNSLEILRQFKDDGYDVIKLTDLKDFEDIFLLNVKTVILCEDIFGRTNNVFTQNSDVKILDRVNVCVKTETKVVFTIRDIVKRSCKWLFSSYRLFHKSAEVDISSKELDLKVLEKKEMFEGYSQVNNFKIVGLNESENFRDEVILDENVTVTLNRITLNQIIETEPLLGFPETCCLFTRNRKFARLGEAFFKHPSSCLTEEIENLRKSGKNEYSHKIKYSLLVYTLLNEDSLDKNQINTNQMNDIVMSCYHNSENTILEHYLFDAIDEMIGQYLIKKYDRDSYQFQHQTIFESVLISYSKINLELILSKLAFNFIREMVRLEGFQEKEGEIVMKIPVKYYPNLCKRIIEILKTEYCGKSQNLVQLLCDSEIIRQNDATFINTFVEDAHTILPLQDSKTIISFQDEIESVNFYLPAALLEHLIKKKNMIESLVPILEHSRCIFERENRTEIVQSCKASVLSVFVSAILQDHTKTILSLILNLIKDFKLTSDNDEYFTNVACSTPPSNQKLMIWLLKNIGMEYLNRKALCLEMCLRNWTNLLHLLKKDNGTSGIDLTSVIKELCSSGKYEVVKWLVEKISCFIRSMVSNINATNDDSINWLIENVDESTFNMQTAFNEVCSTGNIHIVQWLIQNYNEIVFFDMKTALNESCREGNICVATWLLKNTEHSLLDLNMAVLEGCLRNRHDVITLLVDNVDPSSFDINIVLTMCHKGRNVVVEHLLRIVSHFTLPVVIDCARKACKLQKLEIVQWLIPHLNSDIFKNSNDLFDMKSALNIACQSEESKHVVEFVLQNVEHKHFDMTTAILAAIRKNKLEYVKLLIENDTHLSIDINVALIDANLFDRIDIILFILQRTSNTHVSINTITPVLIKACDLNRPDIAKLVLDKYDHTLFDMKGIMNKACFKASHEIFDMLIALVDDKLFDMKTAMTTALHAILDTKFQKQGLQIVKFFLKNIDQTYFDMANIRQTFKFACRKGKVDIVKVLADTIDDMLTMKQAMNTACYYGYLDIVEWLVKNIDHKYFNMKTSIKDACMMDNLNIVEWLATNIDNTLFDVRVAMNIACSYGKLNIVKWLTVNFNNTQYDMDTAIKCALDFFDCQGFNRNVDIIFFLFQHFDCNLFDIKTVKKLMASACLCAKLDLVQLLTKTVDNNLLDMNRAMNKACLAGHLYLVGWFLDNVDNSLFDMRITMNNACYYGHIDIVKLLVVKVDNLLFDMRAAMNKACSYGNLNIVVWLATNVDNALFDTKAALNEACSNGNLNIVVWLVTNVDNTLFDMNAALNGACSNDNLSIVVWLSKNVEHTLFDIDSVVMHILLIDSGFFNDNTTIDMMKDEMSFYIDICHINTILILFQHFNYTLFGKKTFKILMKTACSSGQWDLVQILVEKVDNTLLGIDTEMVLACVQNSKFFGKWMVENVDKTVFDVKTVLDFAINNAFDDDDDDFVYNEKMIHTLLKQVEPRTILSCTKKLKRLVKSVILRDNIEILQLLIQKVDNTLLGIDNAINIACSLCSLETVELVVQNVDSTLLDMNTVLRNVSSTPHSFSLVTWVLDNVDNKHFDMNILFVNASSMGNLEILKLIFEKFGSDMLDMKTALNESCLHGHFTSVRYILERFDIQHFDLTTAMIKVCRSQSENSVEIGDWLWNKFNHDLFDVAKAMNNACRYGNLQMSKWLFCMNNIDLFDMSEAFCSACQCDNYSVVEWIIINIPTEQIDVHKAIKNTCRNNSDDLSIIEVLVQSSEEMRLDLNVLVKEACKYERIDVIEWMLQNCDKDSFRILDILTSLVSNDTSPETRVIDRHDKSEHESNKQNRILKMLEDNTFASFDYNSVLIKASLEGWIDIFEWIIATIDNAELDITNAVNEASQNGRRDIIEWSLSNLNPDQIDTNTILVEASGFGWTEIVKNISNRPIKNKIIFRNAMNDACTFGRAEVVIWLLKNNAKEMFDLSAVMNAACINGWMNTLNWILENTDYKLLNLYSAVTESCAAGNINIVQFFFNTFGKVYFDQQEISTRIFEKSDNEKVVLFLLENLNADGFSLDNILIKASGFGWLEVVSWMMEYSREINTVGAAFENACVNGEIDIVKYLQDRISLDNIQTGLLTTCKSGFEEIVEVLLDSVKHEHLDMATVLNEACRCGEQTVVELLLKKVDNALFDKRAAINEACKSIFPEDLVYFLIKDLQNNDFENEVVSENAHKHRWTKVLMQLKRKS